MNALTDWVKKNKLASLLIIVVVFFLAKNYLNRPSSQYGFSTAGLTEAGSAVGNLKMGLASPNSFMSPIGQAPAPTTDITNRMVVQESYLSLVVKNVSQALTAVKNLVTEKGGYMIESELSRPDDAPSGRIDLRIPQEKLDETLASVRALAVKVVSENLKGTDVTDQFVDNETRLKILEGNMARFAEIMAKADKVLDILQVQQEIFNLQTQIEAIKGQQNYLTKTSQMARVTIFLSTDELALPYAPSESWRPGVIFKQAVRGLLKTGQNVGTWLIWLAVYAVVWAPVLLVALYLYRRFSKPRTT